VTKINSILLLILLTFSGCASYEKFRQITEELEIPSNIYQADYNQTWQAVIQVMKRFDIAYQNQESGKVKTRWMDNTLQVNFTDSFGSSDAVKAAEFKLVVNVAEGYSYGRKVTKVTVFKRQRVEQDFLQGWREQPTDGIQEKTLLYRVGILIGNDNKLKELDKEREKEQLESF
jgi:hypothetical protein